LADETSERLPGGADLPCWLLDLPCLFWQQISCLFLRQQLPEQSPLGIAFGLNELPFEDGHIFVVKKFFHDVLRSGW
jgi:hypothetical protein